MKRRERKFSFKDRKSSSKSYKSNEAIFDLANSKKRREGAMKRIISSFLTIAAVAFFTAGIALVPAAAQTTVIFQDGFESGNITAGGWTYSGAMSVDNSAYNGSYAARIDDSGYLQKVVSTVGYDNITLKYARYTYGYDLYEYLSVFWSTDGSNWNRIERYTGDWAVNQVQLGSGAAQKNTLYIRFSSNASGMYERFRIDDVVVSGSGGGGGTPPPSSCLDTPVASFKTRGPYSYTARTVGSVKMWVPNLPTGCKVPIVHLANGTGATCSMYSGILQHFASHGFISACYESTNTGQGTQAITAINSVIAQYPNLVDTKYGFTGHSQGGGGAILGVYRAEQTWGSSRTYTGFGIEPAHGYGDSPSNWQTLYSQIKSPISMFNGSQDGLVSASWVRRGYDALSPNIEKAWYEAVGASHMTPIPQDYASEFGLAWFRWKLLGDSQACQYFKNMPNSSSWRLQKTDNLSPCN
jgi:hypothetical protein